MQFIDLSTQRKRIQTQIDRNIQKVLDHGKYIMGPEVTELELRLSEYIGIKHAVACSSGTDALLLSLMAYGVGSGDAIFVPSFTFIATAEVVRLLGATPVFIDIEPGTFNIDPRKLEKAINAIKTNDASIHPIPTPALPVNENQPTAPTGSLSPRGIIPVDLFGLTADYNKINKIAENYDMFVIEDAAQSFGAEYYGGKAASLADISCTSFFPAKPLGCYGDGGMCFTNNDELAEIMRSLRVHGKGSHKYDNARIGINGRIDTLQAAILLAKFDIFPEEVVLRNEVANRYNDFLKTSSVSCPVIETGYKSVWAQYSILAKDSNHRKALQDKLKEVNVPTAVYYPKPLHLQTAFSSLGYKVGDLPICENISDRIFSIPMHPYVSETDQLKIASFLND